MTMKVSLKIDFYSSLIIKVLKENDMQTFELLLQGKYNYIQNDKVYSEENFTIKREDKANENFLLESETLTRTRTGEFLKTLTEYGFTSKFNTTHVKVRRLLGDKSSLEEVNANHRQKMCTYTFSSNNTKQSNEIYFGAYVHFAAPCFVASMLMTQMKKIDPVHRTQYSILTSQNIWDYQGEAQESTVYVELQEMEPVTIELGGNDLKATHCKLLQVDENGTIATSGHDLYLSKYFGIPYRGIFEDGIVIEIENLKNFESKYKKLF